MNRNCIKNPRKRALLLGFAGLTLFVLLLSHAMIQPAHSRSWPPQLPPPRIISIETVGASHVRIRYHLPSGGNGVNVWRSRDPYGHFRLVQRWPGHNTVMDEGLYTEIEPPERVTASIDSGSGLVVLSWPHSRITPSKPAYYRLSAWGENMRESLQTPTWHEKIVLIPRVEHYLIYRWSPGTGLRPHGQVDGSSNTFTDHHSISGAEYKYAVRPVASDGTTTFNYAWTPGTITVP